MRNDNAPLTLAVPGCYILPTTSGKNVSLTAGNTGNVPTLSKDTNRYPQILIPRRSAVYFDHIPFNSKPEPFHGNSCIERPICDWTAHRTFAPDRPYPFTIKECIKYDCTSWYYRKDPINGLTVGFVFRPDFTDGKRVAIEYKVLGNLLPDLINVTKFYFLRFEGKM